MIRDSLQEPVQVLEGVSFICSGRSVMRSNVRPVAIAVAAAVFAVAAPSAIAQIYKWTNEDGTTTYSNEAPAEKAAAPDVTVIVPEAPRVEVQPAPVVKAVEQQAKSAEPAIKSEPETPRAPIVRPNLPLAVQDPCLRSSDRFCHQKHSAYYKPYVGYSPDARPTETTATVVPPARGATASAAAGGTLSGGTKPKRD